ncbi:LPS export ABC transporter permease LptF [Coxiella-like endosymbiont]|uniref:LPS export ABC transporter permease LptF n=1 Tax=Coxiella-like endosymbiont TaxID=1592897 RepID=UPI00272D98C4|nr:LPS export ABC transporter permease LptF [Coxiella-like endosymbiont]
MIVFRYLSKEILSTLLATTLILLIIFIINQFIHYLNDAAAGKITVKAVMEIMSLQVPLLLGYLLPLSLFLGSLLALGRMSVDHEVVVLTACGVSRSQIIVMIMIIATFITLIVAWLMLSVEPRMEWYRAKILNEALATASLAKIIPGRFQPLGSDGKVFYAGGVNNHHRKMVNVFLVESEQTVGNKERWSLVSATEAGENREFNNSNFVLFKNGSRYVGMPGDLKYDVIKFGQYGIRLDSPQMSITGKVQAIPTTKLWRLSKTDLKAAAELQWRLAIPISVWIFALLAVPLSEPNPRKGKFAQILPAVLIYIVYANLMFLSRAWIENGVMSPTVGLEWINGSLLVVACTLFFFQSHWWHRLRLNRKAPSCDY